MKSDEYNALQRKQQEYLVPTERTPYTPPVSLADAVARSHQAISVVRRTKEKELTTWVRGQLITTLSYLGCFGKVTDYQVKTLANRICDKYYYLTPAELDYFFIAFSNGEYRRMYNASVTPQDVMVSLAMYERDVLTARGEAEDARRQQEEKQKREAEERKPHGWQAWEIYCKENGLDPDTHRIRTFTPKNVNKESNNNKQKE